MRGVFAVFVVAAIAVLGACREPCGQVSCAGPSLIIDLKPLPVAMRRDGVVTACYEGHCTSWRPVPGEPLTSVVVPFESNVNTVPAPPGTALIALRIAASTGGRFTASTATRFPVWTNDHAVRTAPPATSS